MRLSKGVVIRALIYLPLLGFFGWRAASSCQARTEPPPDPAPAKADGLAPYNKTFTMPDGTHKTVPVLTPEQAKELGYALPNDMEGSKDGKPKVQPDPAAPAGTTGAR